MDHRLFASRVLIACFACLSACHCVPSPRGQQGGGERALQPLLQNPKAAAGGEKCPSAALGPSARSPDGRRDSARACAADFDFGWMGVGRPSWKMRAPLRNLPWGHAAATRQLVVEERLSPQ